MMVSELGETSVGHVGGDFNDRCEGALLKIREIRAGLVVSSKGGKAICQCVPVLPAGILEFGG